MATEGGIIKRSGIILVQTEAAGDPGSGPPGAWAPATQGFVAYEIELSPLANISQFERKPIAGDSFIGMQTPVPGIRSSTLSFKVPLAGAGGTITTSSDLLAQWDPILKACGMTPTAGGDPPVQQEYVTGFTTTTLAFALYQGPSQDDGTAWKLFETYGAVGNCKIVQGSPGEPLMLEFEFQGTYVAPIDTTDPGDPTLTEIVPEPFLTAGIAWTPDGGSAHSPRVRSFELDLGNEITQRTDINTATGIVSFIITAQNPKISMQIDEETVAGRDYWTDLTASNFGVLTTGTIGPAAGNKYLLKANRAVLEACALADGDGMLVLDTTWACAQDISALGTAAVSLMLT